MSEDRRARIVRMARSWIGTPYLHQASQIGCGCDCLGLVRGVWREMYGREPQDAPPYTPDWAEAAQRDLLLEAAQLWLVPVQDFSAGDVLLFRWREGAVAKHCGIATSATTMIHAHEGACVCEVALVPAWRRRIVGAFSFPDP